MADYDLIFKEEFRKSKEFKEWHKSYVSVINHALEPTNEFIKYWKETYGERPKSKRIKDDDPWAIKITEEITTLKTDLIIKSIELGLFFKELSK